MSQNMDQFTAICLAVFKMLYEEFPKKLAMFSAVDLEKSMGCDFGAQRQEWCEICEATMEFLSDEGYITYSRKSGMDGSMQFFFVRLSVNGMMAMNKVPKELSGETVGKRVSGMGMDVLAQAGGSALGAMLAAIFGNTP